MSGIGNIIYNETENEKQRLKDLNSLKMMKELEEKFSSERDIIITKTPCGIRKKYVKKDGK